MPTTRIRKSADPKLPERLRPRKSPRQKRAQDLVAAVLEAGSRILIERGYAKLSMQRVSQLAGVSPGSLYQYFPDKDSLVTAIIEAQSERELAFHLARFEQLPSDATLEQALELMVRAIVDFQRQEGPLMRRTLEALPHLGRYPKLAERARQATLALRGLLELHRDRITIPDLDLATHVLANALHSLTHDGVLQRPDSLDDETLVRELMRLSLGYLGRR
jgi:AcrR family transcriptional regulator